MNRPCGGPFRKRAFGKLRSGHPQTASRVDFAKAFGNTIITKDHILKALAQFERTLISADPEYDQYLAGTYKPTAQELRGMQLFESRPNPKLGIRSANCGHRHGGVKTFKELFHNNGLDRIATDIGREQLTGQSTDRARFRVPTLRNIMLTAPYLHDGHFTTIAQVLGDKMPASCSMIRIVPTVPLGSVLFCGLLKGTSSAKVEKNWLAESPLFSIISIFFLISANPN